MKVALIVPAYKPTADMIPMLEKFVSETDFIPVVVDDGSGNDFEHIFAKVPNGTTLLRHEVNMGKGAALKTAMRHILDKMPECEIAVTADADGQHRYADIINQGLKVIDFTAATMCMENNVPTLAFGLNEENSIVRAVCGENLGTMIKV